MWQKLPAFIRSWPILIVGVVLILSLFYLASSPGPSSQSSAAALSQNSEPAPVSRPKPALNATAARQVERTPAAPPAAPPATQAPAMSHEQMAAAPAATQTSEQGAPASKTEVGAVTGDVATGKLVFRKCQACHSLEPGKNGLGPSLSGIIGKKASSVTNYNYSPAMKSSNLTWDVATLDAYLIDPQKSVPGNKMPFPGLKTENERKAVIAFLAAGPQPVAAVPAAPSPQAAQATPPAASAVPGNQSPSSYVPGLRYTLRTGIAEGRMVFIGVGGSIDGQVNPVLSAAEGQGVQVTLINGEGAEHDIVFAEQEATARSAHITGRGASTNIAFRAGKAGDYIYFCSLPGHQLAGMQGQFLVTPQAPPQTLVEADISKLSTDLPPPIAKRAPQTIHVDLTTVE